MGRFQCLDGEWYRPRAEIITPCLSASDTRNDRRNRKAGGLVESRPFARRIICGCRQYRQHCSVDRLQFSVTSRS